MSPYQTGKTKNSGKSNAIPLLYEVQGTTHGIFFQFELETDASWRFWQVADVLITPFLVPVKYSLK